MDRESAAPAEKKQAGRAVEFGPNSPWSQPPIHRPAPRPTQAERPRYSPAPVRPTPPPARPDERDDVDPDQPRAYGTASVPLFNPPAQRLALPPHQPDGAADNYAFNDDSVRSGLEDEGFDGNDFDRNGFYGNDFDGDDFDGDDFDGDGFDEGAFPDRPNPGHPYQELEVRMGYAAPTAEEFATRRGVRPRDWVATEGVRAAARRSSFGLIRLRPGRRERDGRIALTAVRRAFGGLRQITVVNPKGGAGKTVATLMLGLTFGQARGGFVLAWDNNETQGTLGMRAQPDLHARTVRDLLHDLDRFERGNGRVGELAAYVRGQEEAMFDVLASDEAATAGEMLTARAFRDIRDVVGRFYKLILVDTGNNVRAENWQAAVDASDQLVITMSARNDSAETAARLLDHLEQTGRRELVRRAVTVVTMPPHRKEVNPRRIERHFDARCRTVLRVPYDKHLDSGAPVRYNVVSPESRRAWLRVAAAVADGL
jgi:MinD-like ATPase involved in chromosome partitioning or flagellar assembly